MIWLARSHQGRSCVGVLGSDSGWQDVVAIVPQLQETALFLLFFELKFIALLGLGLLDFDLLLGALFSFNWVHGWRQLALGRHDHVAFNWI